MQSKMIFKDHIDRLSIDVRLNNNYDMVCGIIFFPRFYISDLLIQYNTSKNLSRLIHLSYDEFQINFVLLENARNIFGIRVASLKMFTLTYNLRLRKFHNCQTHKCTPFAITQFLYLTTRLFHHANLHTCQSYNIPPSSYNRVYKSLQTRT